MGDMNKERLIVVGLEMYTDEIDIETSLDELERLVDAAGGLVCGRLVQKKDSIDPAYFIGKGKALEIKTYADSLEADAIVFNDELSGAQIRNLEELICRKIIDRTNLILDIFAKRAKTKEGKLQVKLAQLKYKLPRLVGYRDYLSREGGGIGTRGLGEQKLELDRRVISKEISKIERELKETKKSRDMKRNQRNRSYIPIVSLVGYTNAGKSTLLNKVIEQNDDYDKDKDVFVYDMLFATLDTSLRQAKLRNGQPFLLTDTVGFVDKLPTTLIEAFKGTLEEVIYSDLILHVIDISDENIDMQVKVTYDILEELDVLDKPIITVFNKADKVDLNNIYYDYSLVKNPVYVSGKTGKGIDNLLDRIEKGLPHQFKDVILNIPYTDQGLVEYFLDNYNIDSIEYLNDGTKIELAINEVDYKKYKSYIIG